MMNTSVMTCKERWLAALRLEPVDRLPFWPKLDTAYLRAQAAPFACLELESLHAWVGSDRHAWVNAGIVERRERTGYREIVDGAVLTKYYDTPGGVLTGEEHFDARSQAWYPVEYPVKRREDLALLTGWFADARYALDETAVEEARGGCVRAGQEAVVGTVVGTSPFMAFIEFLAGAEGAHFFLHDEPDDVVELLEVMHRVMVQKVRMAARHGCADLFYLMENTSTTLLSPTQYRTYCLPHLSEYARLLADAGCITALHMCGHLKALLPDLSILPVHAFEAFTSPPVGNTTLLDGRSACPNTCLIGGTSAALWMRTAGDIIAQLTRDLDALPHHRGLVVSSAGVMPPCCPPDTVKVVGDWVKAFAAGC